MRRAAPARRMALQPARAHLGAGHPHIGVGCVTVAVRARLVRDDELHAEGLLQDGAVEHLALQEEVAGLRLLRLCACRVGGGWPCSRYETQRSDGHGRNGCGGDRCDPYDTDVESGEMFSKLSHLHRQLELEALGVRLCPDEPRVH